jgi:hypothetical protein
MRKWTQMSVSQDRRMSALLIFRGLIGLAFAAYLRRSHALTHEQFYFELAGYLIVDGVLAWGIAGAMVRESLQRQREREMVLSIVLLVDGIGRVTAGIAVLLWPGIPGFPVTAALFNGVMAASTAAVGLAEAWLTAREEIARPGRQHQRGQFMAGPVGIASLVSIAFGVAITIQIGSPATVRSLISWFVAAAGAVALAMAWSHARMEPAAAPPAIHDRTAGNDLALAYTRRTLGEGQCSASSLSPRKS